MTWPILSLNTSKIFTKTLKDIFADTRLEDLWIPTFCVSANLSEYQEHTHHTGITWQAVRAGCSLPGLFPPVVIDHQLHVDGGVLNNFPIDIMRERLGHKALIIGIELFHDKGHLNKNYNFPSTVSGLDILFSKWMSHSSYVIPPYTDTLLYSLLIGANQRQVENSKYANILIRPVLNNFKLKSLKKGQKEELYKLGYQQCLQTINEYLTRNGKAPPLFNR